jgi:hypothetical protein
MKKLFILLAFIPLALAEFDIHFQISTPGSELEFDKY